MKKWSFALIFLAVIALYYYSTNDDLGVGDAGFEQVAQLPEKNQSLPKTAYDTAPTQKKQSHASLKPNEVAIALDKTVDSRVAAKFDPKARVPSSLTHYFSEDTVQINRRRYLISHELRSIKVEDYEGSMGNEVFRQNGHVYFESSSNSIGLPTLFNQRNRSVALLTGRVLVKNIDAAKARELAQKQGSRLDESMSHLGVYAFEVGSNVLEVVSEIGSQISEAEIFEGQIHEK